MSTATATMTTQQVADRLVSLCREGNFEGAVRELYHKDIVSTEPAGAQGPERLQGFDNVIQKTIEWGKSVEEVHSSKVSGPIVAGNHFAVSMEVEVTMKGAGRIRMDEVAVYEVANGKITRDQFFYNPAPNQN